MTFPRGKGALAEVLARPPGRVLVSEHLACDGRALFIKVGELGCEGIVSKRLDATYTSGPSTTWLKCKHASIGEFPVIGYAVDGPRVESLLVAEPCSRGLRPVGRVEFWRSNVLDDDARQALAYLTRPSPCIHIRPSRGVHWTEPRLIATVRHFGRTGSALRAAVLHGLSVAPDTAQNRGV